MLPYLDVHTHFPASSAEVQAIVSMYYGQRIPEGVQQGSAGLHPWHLEEIADWPLALDWLREQARRPDRVAIGEAGLDKVAPTDWALQLRAFEACVEVSEASGKPLMLHCVRAFGEMLALHRQHRPTQAWIFHGFDKHPHTARMLLRAGCYLSFGAALLRPDSHAAAVLRQVPAERFFLETDTSHTPIQALYEQAAALRGCGVAMLKEQIWANARTVGMAV